MNWLTGYAGRVETDVSLAPLTSFNLGGPARWMVWPADEDSLSELLRRAGETDVSYKVLGGGANVLVGDDGFDGLVVRLDEPHFRSVEHGDERVRVGAGVELMPFLYACARKGVAGIEGLAGIPGTVGGSVRMNAGGRYGEIADAIETVDLVGDDGDLETVDRDDLGFGYRSSGVGRRTVVSATLRTVRRDPDEVLDRFRSIWEEKKREQPMGARCAGCVFKNPPGQMSAGELIDRAGLKGCSSGGASVSTRHANFVVTSDHATSGDVRRLIDVVRDRVARVWSVELEPEIDIW